MPHVTCSEVVETDIQTLWQVFLDKVENPQRYMQFVKETRFPEDTEDYVVREIITDDMTLTEKITLDEKMGEVKFELVDHPLFEGYVLHAIVPPDASNRESKPVVTVTMNWTPKNQEGRAIEAQAANDIRTGIEDATKHLKLVAEGWGG